MANTFNHNDKVVITDGGNVGIGVSTSTSRLEVLGTSDTADVILVRKSSTGSGRGALGTDTGIGYLDLYNDSTAKTIRLLANGNSYINSGNVGIGTTAPNALLSISKTISSDTRFLEINNAGNNQFRSDIDFTVTSGGITVGRISSIYPTGNDVGLSFSTYGTSPSTGLHERMRINGSNGNVGIGTDSPFSKLEILQAASGTPLTLRSQAGNSGNVGIRFSIADNTVTTDAYNKAAIYLAGAATTNALGNMVFAVNNTASSANVSLADERMRITSAGNVGIGTTSPTGQQLDIASSQGSATNSAIRALYPAGGGLANTEFGALAHRGGVWTAVYGKQGSASSAGYFDGNVGIGTASPDNTLHVHKGSAGTVTSNSNAPIVIENSVNAYLNILVPDASESGILFGRPTSNVDGGIIYNSNISRGLEFRTAGNTYRMGIDSNGNVGIGTTSPQTALHVGSTGTNAYSSTITSGSNMKGIKTTLSNNADDMVGIYFATGTNTQGTHWSGITGSRSQSATDWSTQLNFYTHDENFSNINDATQKMVIKGSGNVGIGTTDPGTKLDVIGNLRVSDGTDSGYVYFRRDRSDVYIGENAFQLTMGAPSGVVIETDSNGNGFSSFNVTRNTSSQFWIADNGNVGINTTNPSQKLHVVGKALITDDVQLTGSNPRLDFNSNGASSLRFYDTTNATERMRITSSGNVGIGTDNPGSRLDVKSPTGDGVDIFRVLSATTGSSIFRVYATTGIGGGLASVFDQTGTEKVRLYSTGDSYFNGGNVGIGTTSPDSKFHVEDANPEVRITGTGGTSFPRLLWEYPVTATQASRWALTASASGNTFYLYNYTQSKKIFQVDGTASHITLNHDAAGTTQIGTSTTQTAYQLYVKTNVGQTGAIEASGAVKITSGALGVNIAASATAGRIDASNDIVAYSTSDKRLKENIKPLENATEKVKKLTGVEFDWKQEHKDVHGYEGHDVGVIAQEVQEVLPEAIRTNDSGYLSVRYEKLIGLLIESNKELAARVEELEQKLKQ